MLIERYFCAWCLADTYFNHIATSDGWKYKALGVIFQFNINKTKSDAYLVHYSKTSITPYVSNGIYDIEHKVPIAFF